MAIDPATATVSAIWIVLIRVAVGALWLRSGIPKVLGREYLDYRKNWSASSWAIPTRGTGASCKSRYFLIVWRPDIFCHR
jgi:uncharacterized membrane protein YphA (DoxX/SURF4 family)